ISLALLGQRGLHSAPLGIYNLIYGAQPMATATRKPKTATYTASTAGPLTHKIEELQLKLRGIPGSLLVVHSFTEKAKEEIRQKQQKKAKAAKEERRPEEECEEAKIINVDGLECIPVMALKKAIISAATAFDDLTKVALRQALFVKPQDDPASML